MMRAPTNTPAADVGMAARDEREAPSSYQSSSYMMRYCEGRRGRGGRGDHRGGGRGEERSEGERRREDRGRGKGRIEKKGSHGIRNTMLRLVVHIAPAATLAIEDVRENWVSYNFGANAVTPEII